MKSTKEYLDAYFTTLPEKTAKKIRGQLDRPELYRYEDEIGKSLGEWNTDDVLGFLKLCDSGGRKLSLRAIEYIYYLLGRFYDWYIDNVEIIKNPCRSQSLKGKITSVAKDMLGKTAVTKEEMETACSAISKDEIPEVASYYEFLIRAAYDGFQEAREFVQLKEGDINFEKKSVTINGAEHVLSDRTFNLMTYIHRIEEYPAYRGSYVMVSYDGSYIKFPTREAFANDVDSRGIEFYMNYISKIYSSKIRKYFDHAVGIKNLYLRGFCDRMTEIYGEEKLRDMVLSEYDTESSKELLKRSLEYGMSVTSATYLKREMSAYI